ncbi:Kinesin light chain 3 [Rhizophlyctis rosea]|nr:Kinesin light chain 3 [Rhizophlyctis rosea]
MLATPALTDPELPNVKPLSLQGVRLAYLQTFIEECGGRQALETLTTADVCERFIKPRTDETKSLCDHLLNDYPSINPSFGHRSIKDVSNNALSVHNLSINDLSIHDLPAKDSPIQNVPSSGLASNEHSAEGRSSCNKMPASDMSSNVTSDDRSTNNVAAANEVACINRPIDNISVPDAISFIKLPANNLLTSKHPAFNDCPDQHLPFANLTADLSSSHLPTAITDLCAPISSTTSFNLPLDPTDLPSTHLLSSDLTASVPFSPSTNLASSDLPSSDLLASVPPSADLPSADLPSADLPPFHLHSSVVPASPLPSADLPSANIPSANICAPVLLPSIIPSDHLPPNVSLTGTANWFISHSWQYVFLEVVDAITTFFENQEAKDEVIIWFDLFSLPQHQRTTVTPEFLQTTFKDAISSMGNVLMVLTPWNAPITLTRAWCVFELYVCAETKSKFHIALSPSEASTFRNALKDNPEIFNAVIASINSETATIEADLIAIRSAIQQTVGYFTLNRLILSTLVTWMVNVLQLHLQSIAQTDGLEYAKWQAILGDLYMDQGMYDEAEPLVVDALDRVRGLLHEDDPVVLNMVGLVGALYHARGKFEQAESLIVECLEGNRRAFGEEHPATLTAMNNVADLYSNQGQYSKAEHIFLAILERRKRMQDEDHPGMLTTLHNLATLYGLQGKRKEQEMLFIDCWERRKRVLGEDHPNTLSTQAALACVYFNQSDGQKAGQLLSDCLQRERRILGEDHRNTLMTLSNLALAYNQQGMFKEAELLCVDCLERRRRALGEDHPDTLETVNHLA